MAVQLIPTSDQSGLGNQGIQGFTNTLMALAQQKQQQEQQAAEMLMRQRAADEQSQMHRQALQEHQRQLRAEAIDEVLKHKDNPEMARLVAQKYGVNLDTMQAPTVGSQTGSPGMVPGGQGASPVPSSPVASPPMPAFQAQEPNPEPPPSLGTPQLRNPAAPPEQTPANPADNTVRVRTPLTITAGEGQSPEDEHLDYAHQLLTHDNAVSKDLEKVSQFEQADQAVKSGAVPGEPSPVFNMNFQHGPPVSIDTGKLKAAEQTDKQRRLKDYGEALSGNPKALETASWMVHMGFPDEMIGKALIESGKIDQRYEDRLKAIEAQNANKVAIETQKEGARKALEAQGIAAGKFSGGAGAVGPDGFNAKIAIANDRALKQLDTSINTWSMRSGLQQLAKTQSGIPEVRHQIQANNPIAAAAALEKLTALSRSGAGAGAAATNAALSLMQKHLSGTYGSIEGFIQHLRTGDFGPEQKKNLSDAVDILEQGIRSSAAPLHQQYVDSYYNDTYKNLKRNVERQEEAQFGVLGFHPRYDPGALGIEPMSGHLPTKSGREMQGSTGGGGTTGFSGRHMQMMQEAQQALKDPNTSPEEKASAQALINRLQQILSNVR